MSGNPPQQAKEEVPAEPQTKDLEKDLKSKFKDESHFRYGLCKIIADGFNLIGEQLSKHNELLEEQNELIRDAK